ncbi:FixH family protein [Sporosarcina sp. NPDC096371]|uniref:FixH family protein n=1 Tax=Sporosarcina sp. NPDC096371 TaxID=3364530 RepID=UPI003821C683
MKRKSWIFILVLVLATMAACSNDKPKDAVVDETPQPIAVDLTVTEEVEVNGTVKMEAVVTQGDEEVEDADEVLFEIWEEGKKDESVKIESVNKKDGLYAAETTFDHDGLFHVQVHVTARGLHTMPKKEVTVGNGGKYEEEHNGEEHGEHEHAEPVAGFAMRFAVPENVKAESDVELVVDLQMDGAPLEKARVRYEIWNEANPDKHDWSEAAEPKAGEYDASYVFAESGTFNIQIHVEDDNGLHEHEVFKVVVE